MCSPILGAISMSPAFRNNTHFPFAILIPLFMASYTPRSGSEIHRKLRSSNRSRNSIVPSQDAPSTITCSIACRTVWFLILRIVRRRSASWFLLLWQWRAGRASRWVPIGEEIGNIVWGHDIAQSNSLSTHASLLSPIVHLVSSKQPKVIGKHKLQWQRRLRPGRKTGRTKLKGEYSVLRQPSR